MSWKTGKCSGGLESFLADWKVVEETGKWLIRLESAPEDWKVFCRTEKCSGGLQSVLDDRKVFWKAESETRGSLQQHFALPQEHAKTSVPIFVVPSIKYVYMVFSFPMRSPLGTLFGPLTSGGKKHVQLFQDN